jgi:hypothetical protein
VVDEEAAADMGAGVYFDSGKEAVELRKKTGEKLDIMAPEKMVDAVCPDSVKSGVAEDNLEHAPGGRVFSEYCFNVLL